MVAFSTLMKKWAVSAFAGYAGFHTSEGPYTHSCDVSRAVLTLPANQTVLAAPTNLTASFIGVAFGVQNYTCSSSNTFSNVGAVAELFDISCLYGTNYFNTVQEDLFEIWSNLSAAITVQELIEVLPFFYGDRILAQHFFQPNMAEPGLSPVWHLSSDEYRNDPNAFFVGKGLATLPDPFNPATNIAWLEVGHVSGQAADLVYRTQTLGGQPPTSCTFGTSQNITVKYASKYWFFGGTSVNDY